MQQIANWLEKLGLSEYAVGNEPCGGRCPQPALHAPGAVGPVDLLPGDVSPSTTTNKVTEK